MLDAKVLERINRVHEELTNRGELPTRTQLEQYYGTFRQRFGPQRLASLDGEALLNTMHEHGNRDSLVYWLEFKNDEEFPALFGGIGGGSALKFGIYRRRETGMWTTGSPQKQRELSPQEAIQIAGKHRDQFLEGARLLEDLAPNATDESYAALQTGMDSVAPDVGNSGWGHKYFSLLYPDKLDDYHNASYQRFHLVALLQEPPPGGGRYLVAGRYVALADMLSMPLNHLTRILNHVHGRPHRYWRVGTRLGGVDSLWKLMRQSNCLAVGWAKLGGLSDIRYNRESKERIRSLMHQHYPNIPQAVGRQTQQLFKFVTVIREGDLVLPSDGKRVMGVGRVAGEYGYEPRSDAPHRRPVEWLSWEEWELPTTEGLRTTVHELTKNVQNLIEVERRVLYAPPLQARPGARGHTPSHPASWCSRTYSGCAGAKETGDPLRSTWDRQDLLGHDRCPRTGGVLPVPHTV